MFKKLKQWLKPKKQRLIEPDRIKNEITFTDMNKTEVTITVKHIDSNNYLFIKVSDAEDFILLDQETAILIQAILAEFVKGGTIKNITRLIQG